MDQTQGSARYHTHFYDVAGTDHGGLARRHHHFIDGKAGGDSVDADLRNE